MRTKWMTLLVAGAFGLWGCGQDAATSAEVTASSGLHFKRVSPASLSVPATTDSVLLAWVHDTLVGPQVAVINDTLPVSANSILPASLSAKVGLAVGANRFVLKLTDGTGIWYDTVTVVRGELPTAPSVSLLTPRFDTAHVWEDSSVTVRWKLSGTPLASVTFAGQSRTDVSDSLVFKVVMRPGPDTLLLSGTDAFGRMVKDTVFVKRGYFQGLTDSLANLVVGKWRADTAMAVPQSMRDSLANSPAYAGVKITLDSAQAIRYTMAMNANYSFSSIAVLRFKATVDMQTILLADEWVDSIYSESGTWKVIGDSIEIRRSSCSKALSPYVRVVNGMYLFDEDTTTHGLAVTNSRDNVCAPEISRTRIALEGQAWPITVSGLLPGQDVTMRFVRER
ncbi:MAG: hypothetical protein RL318_369 [Fibrobacterota bacterium]